MKTAFFCLSLISLLYACQSSPKTADELDTKPATVDSPKTFLPVLDFLKGDLSQVDAYGGAILLETANNGKQNTGYIQQQEFHALAYQFLLPELDSASFSQHYSETSIPDPTTGAIDFIYTAKNEGISLRKVMVYISPGRTAEQVNRIYMERTGKIGDTVFTQKLTWKMKSYLIIAENRQTANGDNQTQVKKAIWDPQLFSQ